MKNAKASFDRLYTTIVALTNARSKTFFLSSSQLRERAVCLLGSPGGASEATMTIPDRGPLRLIFGIGDKQFSLWSFLPRSNQKVTMAAKVTAVRGTNPD